MALSEPTFFANIPKLLRGGRNMYLLVLEQLEPPPQNCTVLDFQISSCLVLPGRPDDIDSTKSTKNYLTKESSKSLVFPRFTLILSMLREHFDLSFTSRYMYEDLVSFRIHYSPLPI